MHVEEYLHTSFVDLDREYRDGEVVERSLPDYLHSRTQALLGVFFEALRKQLLVYACPELRMKLRTGLSEVAVLPVPELGVTVTPDDIFE